MPRKPSNSIIALYNRLGCRCELLTDEQKVQLREYWKSKKNYNPIKRHEYYIRKTKQKIMEQWKLKLNK